MIQLIISITKSLLMTSFWASIAALEERPPAMEHTHAIPPGARFCVDTSPRSYVCSDDPMSVRKEFDPSTVHEMDIGLPQRVDGTEIERKGIRQVLDAMDAYYYGEVLSNPEYREVRQYCRNRNELCAFWTYIGECETNRMFMLPNCPAACRLCLLLDTNLA